MSGARPEGIHACVLGQHADRSGRRAAVVLAPGWAKPTSELAEKSFEARDVDAEGLRGALALLLPRNQLCCDSELLGGGAEPIA